MSFVVSSSQPEKGSLKHRHTTHKITQNKRHTHTHTHLNAGYALSMGLPRLLRALPVPRCPPWPAPEPCCWRWARRPGNPLPPLRGLQSSRWKPCCAIQVAPVRYLPNALNLFAAQESGQCRYTDRLPREKSISKKARRGMSVWGV